MIERGLLVGVMLETNWVSFHSHRLLIFLKNDFFVENLLTLARPLSWQTVTSLSLSKRDSDYVDDDSNIVGTKSLLASFIW